MSPSVASCFASLLVLLTSPAFAQTTSFDGTWNVVFTCLAANDDAAGYTRRFLASVQNGVLHGEIGTRGQASYLALDGLIQPDGQATLIGQGMTGNPDYVVGHLRPATSYSFHLQSRFAGTQGTGRRLETRSCDAVFSRH